MKPRLAIIEAARELFLKNGYTDTTVRQISELSNTNLGLIPYYFEKKENLAKIIYDECLTGYLKEEEFTKLQFDNPIASIMWGFTHVSKRMIELNRLHFYYDLMIEGITTQYAQSYSHELMAAITDYYSLDVSSEQLQISAIVLKGVENALMMHKFRGTLVITPCNINIAIITQLCLSLGIDKKEVENQINHCLNTIKEQGLYPEILDEA